MLPIYTKREMMREIILICDCVGDCLRLNFTTKPGTGTVDFLKTTLKWSFSVTKISNTENLVILEDKRKIWQQGLRNNI